MSEAGTPAVGASEQPVSEPNASLPAKNPFAGTKHKVKVDDRELEVPYEELVADYQHKIASNKRFEQANKIRKDVDGLFEAFQKGDFSFLKQVASPELLRKFHEQELIDLIEYEKKSPAEKEALEAKRERDKYKKQLEDKEKSETERAASEIEQRASIEVETEIIEAVKTLGHDVKVTPRLIRRIAEQMQASLRASDDPSTPHLPAKIAAERAWRGLKKDHEEYLSLIKPEDYIAMLPRKLRDAIRKADVDSAISQMPTKSVRNSNQPSEPSEPQTSRAPKLKRGLTDDWFTRMEKTLTKRG